MKQQTTVVITRVKVDGDVWPQENPTDIELEFSAIDTGGGFHDPILDFTYEFSADGVGQYGEEKVHQITLNLQDPLDKENTLKISYQGKLLRKDNHRLKGMGRLKNDDMSRDITKFVMRSVR
jgi:hypothetical protein